MILLLPADKFLELRRAFMTPRAIHRAVGLLGVTAALGWSQRDLGEASLEELLNTKITSVSKKEQKLSQAAAAVFVINQDDIRRSGATSIPDLLRMAPGVEVAQINANRWAVSIRGYNYAYANKVLVLIDGRSVYTGTFSGVIWDQVGMPVEEIERIEVIRGPGGSVWGANAVNGVINIVTRSSQDTKGGMVALGGGSSVTNDDTVRYGGDLGRSGSYRVFGRYSRTSDFDAAGGVHAGDSWDRKQGGFRTDWTLSPRTSLAVEGNYYYNHGGQALTGSLFAAQPGQLLESGFFAQGGDVGAQWKHTLAGGAEESLQLYYTAWDRTEQSTPVSDRSLDVEYQNHFHLGNRHDLVGGLGYRRDTGTLTGSGWIRFAPPTRTDNLVSGFFQDEIALGSAVRLTIGSKFEHNSYTGFEFEPTLRLAWAATPKSTLWASANRAIAQPGQYETSITAVVGSVPLDSNTSALIWLYGNPRLHAEEFRDCELGYRNQFARNVSLDLATFVGSYHSLVALQAEPMKVIPQPGGVQIQFPTVIANTDKSFTYGGEMSVNWDVNQRWRLSTSYSLYQVSSVNTGAKFLPGVGLSTDPKHIIETHSRLDLPGRLEFDQWLWWTSELAANKIPSHTRVDVRLGRRLGESAEIGITGQNLTRPRFVEFGDSFGFAGTANPRSVFGQLRWFF
jgi:iron complex outermembrane receptor protein